MGFETFTQGLATGAFSVLLLRLTQRRFSATQYALFTSMFSITRVLGGVLSGFSVDALGWTQFYYVTMFAGIPGLILLQRFSPFGKSEPDFEAAHFAPSQPISRSSFWIRIVSMVIFAFILATSTLASLGYIKIARASGHPVWSYEYAMLFHPTNWSAWVQFVGVIIFTCSMGLVTAAYYVAKKNVR
jgi:PAT family beta-lactamase induction signal transducer AmpG